MNQDATDNPETPVDLRVSSNRRFWLTRGLGAAAFAAICAWATRGGSWTALALGATGALMFGAFAVYALRQLLRTGPRLVLDASGIEAADLGVGVIAWRDIDAIEPFGSGEAPFIAIHVRDPAPYVARMARWPRLVMRLLEGQGLPVFSVNLIGADRDYMLVGGRANAFLQAANRTWRAAEAD